MYYIGFWGKVRRGEFFVLSFLGFCLTAGSITFLVVSAAGGALQVLLWSAVSGAQVERGGLRFDCAPHRTAGACPLVCALTVEMIPE